MKFYFTGKPCKKGHLSKRRANSKGCIQCEIEANSTPRAVESRRKYFEKNRASINEQTKTWYAANKDRKARTSRVRRLRCGAADSLSFKKRYKKNKQYYFMKARFRKAGIANATPKWADRNVIADFYVEAKYLGLEIDHIVPLVSDIVCGLHCEANLQALTMFENRSKGNRHWPDMP